METITDAINTVVDQSNRSLREPANRPEKHSELPTPRQIKLVSAMWTRMIQLYRHKWTSSEGEIFKDHGKFSDNFLLWTRKTADMTDDNWMTAFESLEGKIAADAYDGKDSWPPSYVEFEQGGVKTISPNGTNSEAYKIYEPERLIEDSTRTESRKKAGTAALSGMKDLFN